MNQNFENYETAVEEALADEKLGTIDLDYLTEQIDSQLDNLMDTSDKKNYLKAFEKQVSDASALQTEGDILSIRETMYYHIIEKISEKFNMTIDMDNADVRRVAKHFYKFFVINYVENLSYFIKSYIIENRDDIVDSLSHMDGINTKKIPELSNDIALILNNLSDIITIIKSHDVDLYDMLTYIEKHPESSSSVEEIREYLNECIEESGEVVNLMLEPLIDEEEDFGEVFINIQMDLYNDFNEIGG